MIRSRPASKEFRANWDRIYKQKQLEPAGQVKFVLPETIETVQKPSDG